MLGVGVGRLRVTHEVDVLYGHQGLHLVRVRVRAGVKVRVRGRVRVRVRHKRLYQRLRARALPGDDLG